MKPMHCTSHVDAAAARRPMRRAWSRPAANLVVALSTLLLSAAPTLRAQSLEDGLLIKPRELRVGVEYGNDAWDRYWEGSLKRTNDNIGTITTRSVTGSAMYGLTSRVTFLASLPYVWTRASLGVLQGMEGRQDLTVAVKLRVLQTTVGARGTLGAVITAGAAVPVSDYTPDFLPLSIGLANRRAIARAALHLKDRSGFFLDGSYGHAWRSNVSLDRPAYFTDGQLVLSDEVAMPDVSDLMLSAGYNKGPWCIPVGFTSQRTLGGGDIRRQDMPFVSNKMDFTRMHARVMYTLPTATPLIVSAGAMRTLSGRNVGESTTIMAGVTYVLAR